ncbi:ankyrin repeats (many copies) domain-containing protein [Trichoderma breve]|uniref:Ankyrin repeats (Many copies) domain-containing protein n=1 Tax=Trichoderma breve TaxID=2034170 RepID=A0A9W9E550_9HYPO|nr:ankyrin repeats (many copies) domain-containing protein [Trichoderma breve]KAJ4855051.1 ankyrin repeats (many copies) domain-containing protein [Trichoderma breve]
MSTPLNFHWLRNHFDTEDEALHACIRDGNLQRLQQLLGASPAPDIQYDSYGFGPPVHFASWCGNLEAVEMLLAAGADPLLVSEGQDRLRAIAYAAARGHRDIVKRLWGFCPPEVHVRRGRQYTSCFIMAANQGHAAIVEDLLDWWDGWPHELKYHALVGAAVRWRLAVATLLLRRTSFEQSTLQEALRLATYRRALVTDDDKGHREAIDYLNQQLMVELLIDAGADPNECPNNTPPLIYDVASDANLTGVLKSLLEKGADPNKTDGSGKSALHVLAEPVALAGPIGIFGRPMPVTMNETAIRLVLQHKGSVSQPDNAGECPLHRAAYGLDLRLFRLYLASCPEQSRESLLQLTNHHGETMLHYAAAGCHIEVMEVLIAQGLDVNAINSNGWTPLMCALIPIDRRYYRYKSPIEAIKAAQFLLSHDADTGTVTEEGLTPLHVLSLHRDKDVNGKMADLTRKLISRGVNPEARARLLIPDSKTIAPCLGLPWGHRIRGVMTDPSTHNMVIQPALAPLYWAAQRGAVGVIKVLLAHGVDVSSMDDQGISATRMAANSKFLERQPELVETIIGLLLAAGAGF